LPVAPVALAVAVNPVNGTAYVASANTNDSGPGPISTIGTLSVVAGPRFPCPRGLVGLLSRHD